ncbi:MAG: class I mannose-6-phosphate isomerase [Novosphingobium sp.]
MDVLPAPFIASAGKRIGEIWFEPPTELPDLLVKYIFVHPSDAQTLAKGIGRQGKEECWLVVAAGPGATVGIGFDSAVSEEAMRAAALDGSIEHLLTWHAVKPGDFFYIPANTVHAIGPGVSLIEVQQNSDITYRLFDYGRPRALHLEEAVTLAKGEIYDLAAWHQVVPAHGTKRLVNGPIFLLDQVEGAPSGEVAARYPGALLVIPRSGTVQVGGETIAPGGCALALALQDVAFADDSVCLLARAGSA